MADILIRNIMQELGYDSAENDDDSDDHVTVDDYQTRARQDLIDSTRENVEKNLKEIRLEERNRDVFIVSSNVVFSLVTAKRLKKTTPVIDEARLIETILKTAHARRYGNQAPVTENHLLTDLYPLALIEYK